MKRYLILASLPALALAGVLLILRAVTFPLWDGADPVIRVGYIFTVLFLLTIGLVGAAVSRRGGTTRNYAMWGNIVGVIGATVFLSGDLESLDRRLDCPDGNCLMVLEFQPRCGDGHAEPIALERSRDGHYYIEGYGSHARIYSERLGMVGPPSQVTCAPVHFLVDTGATGVSLVTSDAERLGVDLDRLDYFVAIETATGTEMAAPVIIQELVLGSVRFENVPALVHPGTQSLLGMDPLDRFASIEMSNNRLILTP